MVISALVSDDDSLRDGGRSLSGVAFSPHPELLQRGCLAGSQVHPEQLTRIVWGSSDFAPDLMPVLPVMPEPARKAYR